MLIYKEVVNSNHDITEVRVFSEGKRQGTIKNVRKPYKGWQYFPKGARHLGGDILPTILAVKMTLEAKY